MDEVNYFFIVYLSLFFVIFNLFCYFFFHKKRSRFAPFSFFLCLNLSDGNHSALHLLHLRQHSLDAGQDLVLVCCRGDAYAGHVSGRKGEKQTFRTKDNNNKHTKA